MGLPILQLPIHIVELPVSKRKVQYKPFVVKEEKSFLTSINTDNQEDIVNLFEKLVENCVIDDDLDVKSLNIVDFFFLIIHIRMKSTSELLTGVLQCKHCEKKTEFEVNLEESLVIENADNDRVVVEVNDIVSLEVIPPRIQAFFQKEKASLVDIIANSVNTVIYEGKVYDEFTVEELKANILSNLVKKEYDRISEGMAKLAKLKTKFKYICIHCAKTNDYETDNIVNFF